MEFLINAFNALLYQPLLNVLVLLYQFFPGRDFGIAIIVLTILIKMLFYPLAAQAIKSQKDLAGLQPKIQEIQGNYKNDKEKQAKEIMALYRKEKINPFSGCLPLLIQLPILIGLFQVFMRGFGPEQMIYLYDFTPNPGQINLSFLGFLNLAEPNLLLAVLSGVCQFFQTKMLTPPQKAEGKQTPNSKKGRPDFSGMLQKQMLYFLPVFTVFILWRLPSAIGLYWLVTSLFSIVQQRFIIKTPFSASAEKKSNA